MFNAREAFRIAQEYRSVFEQLHKIRVGLESRFHDISDAVLALILSVASGEPLLLLGPPGTGKSLLIRRFCALVGVNTAPGSGQYFEVLLTPFTEPGDLFGPWDLARLAAKEGLFRVNTHLMMQGATVVFIDECFKGSAAILHTLLPFMHERVFFDRGQPVPVKMKCMFAASNGLPDSPELLAVLDRFILRCRMHNVADTHTALGGLLNKGWPLTYAAAPPVPVAPGLLERLQALRSELNRSAAALWRPDERFLRLLAQRVGQARTYGVSDMSNRRVIKLLYVMLIHRMYDWVRSGAAADETAPFLRDDELKLMSKYFLDRHDEEVEEHMNASAVVAP